MRIGEWWPPSHLLCTFCGGSYDIVTDWWLARSGNKCGTSSWHNKQTIMNFKRVNVMLGGKEKRAMPKKSCALGHLLLTPQRWREILGQSSVQPWSAIHQVPRGWQTFLSHSVTRIFYSRWWQIDISVLELLSYQPLIIFHFSPQFMHWTDFTIKILTNVADEIYINYRSDSR